LSENHIRDFDFSKAIQVITDPTHPGNGIVVARDASGCPFIGLIESAGVLPLSPTHVAALGLAKRRGIEEAKKALSDAQKEQHGTPDGSCPLMF